MPSPVTDPDLIADLEARSQPKVVTDQKLIEELEARLPREDWSKHLASQIPIAGPLLDKAMAGSNALIRGTSYGEELGKLQEKHERYSQEHPVAATTASLGGGLMMPVAPETAAAKLMGLSGPLPLRVLGSGATGAITGGADAAARGQDIVGGAKVGGAVGAAAPVAGTLAGKAYQGLADWLGPKLPAPLTNLTSRAREMLSHGLGNATPQELMAARSEMGPETFTGELTPGLQNLTKSVAMNADDAANALKSDYTNRMAGRAGRLEGTINQDISGRSNIPQTLEDLERNQRATAAPLYQQAFSKPVPNDPRLQEFIARPEIQKGINTGAQMAEREAFSKQQPFNPNGWQLLDMGKRGMDAMIEKEVDTVGRTTTEGRNLIGLRNAFVQHLDSLNPDYPVARAAWAGPEKFKKAASDAKNFLNGNVDANEVASKFNKWNPSEKEAGRLMARNQLSIMMDRAANGETRVQNLLRAPHTQAKVATMFGPQAAESAGTAATQEANLVARTREVVPNMLTGASNVPREQLQKLSNPSSRTWDYLSQIEPGRPSTWFGGEPATHIQTALASANQKARQQIAPILTHPAENDNLLRALLAARDRQNTVAGRSALTDYLTSRLGTGAGREVKNQYLPAYR